MVALFSYGTLQQREVQIANYGRQLDGEPDALIGYRLEQLAIDDPKVVEVSGKPAPPAILATGYPEWFSN